MARLNTFCSVLPAIAIAITPLIGFGEIYAKETENPANTDFVLNKQTALTMARDLKTTKDRISILTTALAQASALIEALESTLQPIQAKVDRLCPGEDLQLCDVPEARQVETRLDQQAADLRRFDAVMKDMSMRLSRLEKLPAPHEEDSNKPCDKDCKKVRGGSDESGRSNLPEGTKEPYTLLYNWLVSKTDIQDTMAIPLPSACPDAGKWFLSQQDRVSNRFFVRDDTTIQLCEFVSERWKVIRASLKTTAHVVVER